MKELDLKTLNSVVEFESKTDCSECVHNKVCGKKAEYLNIKEYFEKTLSDEADGDQVPFITLSTKCDYFRKEEPVFRKAITGTAIANPATPGIDTVITPGVAKIDRCSTCPFNNPNACGSSTSTDSATPFAVSDTKVTLTNASAATTETVKKVRQILNEGK